MSRRAIWLVILVALVIFWGSVALVIANLAAL